VTTSQRDRWDAKHRAAAGGELAPDPFVVECLERCRRDGLSGRALDLACGRGRHALELLRRGFATTACDISPVGLALAREQASSAGHELHELELDLESRAGVEALIASGPYDVVVVANFLDRSLLGELGRLLSDQGRLIYTTFHVDAPGDKPPRRFRLERGELGAGLSDLTVLAASESESHARLFALRAPATSR